MSPENEDRLDRIREIFVRAIELPLEERAAFIAAECGGDKGLEAEVEALVRAHGPSRGTASGSINPAIRGGMLAAFEADSGPDPLVGTRVGHYLIEAKIAEGGMGAVYEARQQDPSRKVALKVVRHPGLFDQSMRLRFKREVETLARLNHPYVAKVFEAGSHVAPGIGTIPYFAMEFVEGAQSILDHCVKGKLPTPDRLKLIATACEGVHHAHQRGIIHRDLKPTNILVDAQGMPKIIDFGIARALEAQEEGITLTGMTPGTPEYMSPEQCEGGSNAIDVRSDVYSLGVVMFRVLTEAFPFDFPSKASSSARMAIIRTKDPRPLSSVNRSLKGDVEAIVAKALSHRPDDRYQSAADLAKDIRRYLDHEPTIARPPSIVGRLAKFVVRRPWQSVSVATVVAAIVIGIGSWQTVKNQERESAAEKERIQREELAARERLQREELDKRDRVLLGAAEVALRDDQAAAGTILAAISPTNRGWEHRHLSNRAVTSFGMVAGFETELRDLAFSPDGALLAVAADRATYVYDAPRARSARLSHDRDALAVITYSGRHLAFAPGTRILWTAIEPHDKDGVKHPARAVAYDLTDPRSCMLAESIDLPGSATAIAVGPGGVLAVAHREPKGPPVLRIRHGGRFTTLPPEFVGSLVLHLAFSPDGSQLAAGHEHRDIKIWDVRDPEHAKPTVCILDHFFNLQDLAWNADGTRLVSASGDRTAKVWDIPRSQEAGHGVAVTHLVGHAAGVWSADFGPTMGFDRSRYLVLTSSSDRTVRHWQVEEKREHYFFPFESGTPAPVMTISGGHANEIRRLRVSPDRRMAASISKDGTVRTWPIDQVEVVPELGAFDARHQTSVTTASFSPDGRHLASLDAQGWLIIWDVDTGLGTARHATRSLADIQSAAGACVWHPSLPLALISADKAIIGLWDLRVRRLPRLIGVVPVPDPLSLRERQPEFRDWGHLAMSEDGRTLACNNGTDLVVWDLDLDDPRRLSSTRTIQKPFAGPIRSIAISPDGERMALGEDAGGGPAALSVIDLTGTTPPAHRPTAHDGEILRLAFSPGGDRLASAGEDHRVRIWDARTLDHALDLDGHTDVVYSVAWHPREPRLATGSADTTIRIWDPIAGHEMVTLRGNVSPPMWLEFSPKDGQTLAAAMYGAQGTENVAKLWETDDDAVVNAERRTTRAHLKESGDLIRQLRSNDPSYRRDYSLPALRSLLQTQRFGRQTNDKFIEIWAETQALRAWAIAASDVPADTPDTRGSAALDILTAAREAAPEHPLVRRALGAALYRAGRFDEALAALLEVNRQLTKDLRISDYADAAFLAMTYARLGKRDEAAAWHRTLLDVMPPEHPSYPLQRHEVEEARRLLSEVEQLLAR